MGVRRPLEKLSCADASFRLGLMADGELGDESELSELRGHVAVCPSCQRDWRALVDGKRALVAAAAVRAEDEAVSDDVRANIDAYAGRDVDAERVAWASRAVVGVAMAAVVGSAVAAACW